MHHVLTRSFEDTWIRSIENISSPSLRANWDVIFGSFDECIEYNRRSESKKIIVPAITGTAKTQGMIHKAKNLSDDERMLIVVRRTEDADIAAQQIGANACVYHTGQITIEGVQQADTPDETSRYPVLIITHEQFRRSIGNTEKREAFLSGRDLIVIDEQIFLTNSYQISLSELRRIEIVFNKLFQEKRYQDDERLGADMHALRMRIEVLDEFLQSPQTKRYRPLRSRGIEPRDYQTQRFRKESGDMPDDNKAIEIYFGTKKLMQMTRMIEILETDNISINNYLTGINDGSKDSILRNRYLDTLRTFRLFNDQWTYLFKSGNDVSFNTATELIPNKSVVILDATASENDLYKLYEQYQGNLIVKPQIACRNFSNLTINIATISTGRSTLEGVEKDRYAKMFVNDIKNRTNDGDSIMLVTTKTFKPIMTQYMDENVMQAHWGDLTGSNAYRQCDKQFIIGLNHKPRFQYHNQHVLAKNPYRTFHDDEVSNNGEMRSIEHTDIIQETIQAIMRTRARNVVDEVGNCEPTEVYLTVSSLLLVPMEQALKRYLNNVRIGRWEISDTTYEELHKTRIADAIIAELENHLNNVGDQIPVSDIKHSLGLEDKQFSDAIRKKSFNSLLEVLGYQIFTPIGQVDKKGRLLKVGKKFFIKVPQRNTSMPQIDDLSKIRPPL